MSELKNVILTGQTTSSGRFVVHVNSRVVELPRCRFLGLIVLINARLNTLSGRSDLLDFESADVVYGKDSLHKLIQRMRVDFDTFLGAGTGNQLVLHRGSSRYSLAIDNQRISVAPDFIELKRDIPIELYNSLVISIQRSAAGASMKTVDIKPDSVQSCARCANDGSHASQC